MSFSLSILAVGRLKAGAQHDLVQDYRKRIRWPLKITETDGRTAAEEQQRLLAALPTSGMVVGLDERGQTLTSMEFASFLAGWQREAAPVTFVIGGADGLGDAVRGRAGRLLSFGKATWPHQLVRVMLLEQLYRAESIVNGHPYHREG